jgi:hypothetical protein
MTTDEKFDAIIDRLKSMGSDFTPKELSNIVLLGYIDLLIQRSILQRDGGLKLSTIGKSAQAICDEFEWIPSDTDIDDFVDNSVQTSARPALKSFLSQCRDHREDFLETIDRLKRK